MDIAVFQAQALEVLKKLEITQQSLLAKVDIIQNHFQEVNQSLDNIVSKKERLLQPRPPFKKRSCHRLEKKYL
jgi:hypothetical protein